MTRDSDGRTIEGPVGDPAGEGLDEASSPAVPGRQGTTPRTGYGARFAAVPGEPFRAEIVRVAPRSKRTSDSVPVPEKD